MKKGPFKNTDYEDFGVCPDSEPQQPWLATWGGSVVFHVVLLVVLAIVLSHAQPRGSVETGRTATVGIVLKSEQDDKTLYESADNAQDDQDQPAGNPDAVRTPSDAGSNDSSDLASLSELVSSTAPPDIPTLDNGLAGLAPSSSDGESGLENITQGLAGAEGVPNETFGKFGKGTVSCFNTSGTGSRFSFVFDRSGSMGGPGFSPMMAAKSELTRALQSLQSNQQFQIIFYNEKPTVFSPRKLLLADEPNRREALKFLASITPDGGTNHKDALHLALAQHPDVIFFLTDADEPPMTAAELAEIKRENGSTQINTIQFGIGPQPANTNFLMRLAEQNRGQYVYIDVRSLRK